MPGRENRTRPKGVAVARPRTKWIAATLVVAVCAMAAFAYVRGLRQPQRPAQPAVPLPGGIRMPQYGPVGGPRFTNANVVVVTIDTLRRDHVNPYGAPFETLAATRLAREGVLFERAV